ncbi:MAG: helix-turn-helix domain-containing protein, partial [Cyanobacteria bacterium P01_F01_bin.116]
MSKRALTASLDGIRLAKIALIDKFSTQQKLAASLGVTRQPISKFFNGKTVDNSLFVRICEKLGLNWKEIASESESNGNSDLKVITEIEALLLDVRKKIKPNIQEKCGSMRVLDMTHPIGLSDIYTDVNILEAVTGRRWLGFEELLKDFDPDAESFDRRGLSKVTEKRVAGPSVVNKYPKLMVLGKPGAGKSTFLKYLSIQCIF